MVSVIWMSCFTAYSEKVNWSDWNITQFILKLQELDDHQMEEKN